MKQDEPMDRLLERASRPREDAHAQTACLEAETLAAWADGSLTAAERDAAEAHAADCDRCLAVLAAIAKTAPPPSPVAAGSIRPSWFSVRWLLPPATAAIAITTWVLVRGPGEPNQPLDSVAPVTVEAPKPAAPAQPERDATAQARPGAVEREKKEARSADTRTESTRDDFAALRKPSAPPAAAAPVVPPLEERVRQRASGAMQQPTVIASPDPNVRWRVAGAIIERSTDGGRTWTVQMTGTQTPLLAGASPDPRVCWVVGRSGVVLLSTDGDTWRRLEFPDSTAVLVAITATDALSAAVTTADGRTYRTADGGRNWTLQENLAAAF